jgi:hypothetical protein
MEGGGHLVLLCSIQKDEIEQAAFAGLCRAYEEMALRTVQKILFVGTFVMIESSGPVRALTYSDWLKEDSGFRVGYVFGIMESLSSLVEPSSETSKKTALSYQRCFAENKIDSQVGMNIMDLFLRRSPDAAGTPMLSNIIHAMRSTCSKYFQN